MSSSITNNQNIYPKSCVYKCGTRIYWNTATSEYWELFSKKKHVCPSRINNKPSQVNANNNVATNTNNTNRPFYSKNPGFQRQKWSIQQS